MRSILAAGTIVSLAALAAVADDWPQWRGPNRDGVWRERGLVQQFASARLPHEWEAKIGSGYSGPTVANGRVYVTDRLTEPGQVERIHCFDAATGRLLWSHRYDCVYIDVGYEAGPRAAVTLADGRAFALGTMGHLHVLDAASGRLLWQSDLKQRFEIRMPMWGIAAAPLVYKDLLILHIGGAAGACVVALNKATGAEVWRALDDRASYSAPIVITQAGQPVLVCWTGDGVVGLNPSTGKVYWRSEMPPSRMVIGIATPVTDGNLLFVTSFYDGSKMLRLDSQSLTAVELWRRRGPSETETEALHSIIATPLLLGDSLYGVDSYGELRCLDALTGKRIWEDRRATPRARWSNIHMVRNGADIWMFNERGELIIARLSRKGYTEISRTQLIAPTKAQLGRRGGVCWAHPAYANRHVFARNDEKLVCANLAAE